MISYNCFTTHTAWLSSQTTVSQPIQLVYQLIQLFHNPYSLLIIPYNCFTTLTACLSAHTIVYQPITACLSAHISCWSAQNPVSQPRQPVHQPIQPVSQSRQHVSHPRLLLSIQTAFLSARQLPVSQPLLFSKEAFHAQQQRLNCFTTHTACLSAHSIVSQPITACLSAHTTVSQPIQIVYQPIQLFLNP